jgi:hypothetical protein
MLVLAVLAYFVSASFRDIDRISREARLADDGPQMPRGGRRPPGMGPGPF